MIQVPHGNTQKNVNLRVYETILPEIKNDITQTLVDIPCGAGSFSEFVQQAHPNINVFGADLREDASKKIKHFYQTDAIHFLENICPKNVDIIICISGIMCFDRTEETFQHFARLLKKDGTLIVTNDNIHSLRDRLSFMFFGYFKRFKPFYEINEGNWNIVLPQEIEMHLERNGFKNIQVRYTSFYYEDIVFLPLALMVFPISVLGLLPKAKWNLKRVLKIYPFKMLLCRHYAVSAKKVLLGFLSLIPDSIQYFYLVG